MSEQMGTLEAIGLIAVVILNVTGLVIVVVLLIKDLFWD